MGIRRWGVGKRFSDCRLIAQNLLHSRTWLCYCHHSALSTSLLASSIGLIPTGGLRPPVGLFYLVEARSHIDPRKLARKELPLISDKVQSEWPHNAAATLPSSVYDNMLYSLCFFISNPSHVCYVAMMVLLGILMETFRASGTVSAGAIPRPYSLPAQLGICH
jgi:hypothetical protein